MLSNLVSPCWSWKQGIQGTRELPLVDYKLSAGTDMGSFSFAQPRLVLRKGWVGGWVRSYQGPRSYDGFLSFLEKTLESDKSFARTASLDALATKAPPPPPTSFPSV